MYTQKPTRELTEQEAWQKLSALCARAEHSSGEMREKMRHWQLAGEVQERLLQRLIDERFIDDSRFSEMFVRDKVRFDRWGERKIGQALRNKGVAESIVGQALGAVPPADYEDALRPLLAAKRKATKASSDYELRAKLTRFALGRGFTYEVIEKCLTMND